MQVTDNNQHRVPSFFENVGLYEPRKDISLSEPISMTVLRFDDDAHVRSSIGKFLVARGYRYDFFCLATIGTSDALLSLAFLS